MAFLVRVLAVVLVLAWAPAWGKGTPDVSNTKHNLSAKGPADRNVRAKDSEMTQVCVFCHTPHAAESVPGTPLWNRKLSGAQYTAYSSSSIEANMDDVRLNGPGGTSRLCLSCHDGTMALGSVNVFNGVPNAKIELIDKAGNAVDRMPAGKGVDTGFTRNLGVNLTNDHPISFTYDATLATNDGELRTPGNSIVGDRVRGQAKPLLPLENGKVQCSTCHDPHLKEANEALLGAGKFLRLSRFQQSKPLGLEFNDATDIFCLGCHTKAGEAWAYSAHANPDVANETFKPTAATLREFPGTLQVWQASCLSCHDTHTVPGSRRLLREGTTASGTFEVPKSGTGTAAIEETCYQCHDASGGSALNIGNNKDVPDIKSDFTLSTYKMPITSANQGTTEEKHDIGKAFTDPYVQNLKGRGKDFVEDPQLLGKGAAGTGNRHAECTDCHNPHRVIRNKLFTDDPSKPAANPHGGTHNHASGHTNVISGVLRGGTGVEPSYGVATFGVAPTVFALKHGVPPAAATDAKGNPYLTREYQLCLKCHSQYAYNSPPQLLGAARGGTSTPTDRSTFTNYTDQAMEFQAPALHKGRASQSDSGAFSGTVRRGCTATSTCGSGGCVCSSSTFNFQTSNHRAWHPVMDNTGRDIAARGMGNSNGWLGPWNNPTGVPANVGSQTMYCSDCHGSATPTGTVYPGDEKSWGPHGSANRFITKGTYADNSKLATDQICLRCHDATVYNGSAEHRESVPTAFYNAGGKYNLHNYHRGRVTGYRCTMCHVAVPHGWKNRSLLVNLNDVGAEGGQAAGGGTEIHITGSASFTNGPYYYKAKMKIRTWATPGRWADSNCGSATGSGSDSSKTTGKDWMSDNCSSAP